MYERPRGCRKVKVHVIKDDRFPEKIDLAKEIKTNKDEKAGEQEKTGLDWREKYLRLAADLDNTKKRLTQSFALETERQIERLLSDMLEIADNLERALDHADSHPETLLEGVKSIQRQVQQNLERYQVQPFDAEG